MIGVIFLLLSGILCHAEGVCPYLNRATAGGILGEKVAANVSPGVCEFAGSSAVLRIEVTTMSDWRGQFPRFLGQCGSYRTSLRGIGNEAVACAGTNKNGDAYDLILSRVREKAFLVRVSANAKHAAHASLRDESTAVAEQVAGSLF